jgi:uroporphyrinogen decarboxylase
MRGKPGSPASPAGTKRFLEPFQGQALSPPPVWLMRQAGRYLPEYRATRSKAGSFLKLCYNPELAAEVTLQPIRRFGFDAAILFSDILVVPDALGQRLEFVEGEGPKLEPIRDLASLTRLDASRCAATFEKIYGTVARVRADLPKDTALIGFCGAPWTVATYMVEGGGSKDQAETRLWAFRDRDGFQQLMDLLVEVSIEYLSGQVKAGADVLQIFDTWAGSLPEDEFVHWVHKPTQAIVQRMKQLHPAIPVIGFARGAGVRAAAYGRETGVDGLGCDTAMPLAQMKSIARDTGKVVQGNLDPLLLVAGGPAMERRVGEIVAAMAGTPFIFNLGHGIVPQTPPEHVAKLVELVRKGAVEGTGA